MEVKYYFIDSPANHSESYNDSHIVKNLNRFQRLYKDSGEIVQVVKHDGCIYGFAVKRKNISPSIVYVPLHALSAKETVEQYYAWQLEEDSYGKKKKC